MDRGGWLNIRNAIPTGSMQSLHAAAFTATVFLTKCWLSEMQLEAAQASGEQQQQQLDSLQCDLRDSQSRAQDLNDRLGATQVC